MKKPSAEGVLKKTFDQLDKIVDEKNAEKYSKAGVAGDTGRCGRKKGMVDGNDGLEETASVGNENAEAEFRQRGEDSLGEKQGKREEKE